MKILIAGGKSQFRQMLIDRLYREGVNVSAISGKNSGKPARKITNYNFDLSDPKLAFAVKSIMPDAVIFLGAQDEQYDITETKKPSADLLAGLSNMLSIAAGLEIPRFVFLSCASVYGAEPGRMFTESDRKQPARIKSVVLSESENLCLEFNRVKNMDVVILRFADVYGAVPAKPGPFTDYILGDNPYEPELVTPIYVSDAIDAIYKATTMPVGEESTYNVGGTPIRTDELQQKAEAMASALADTPRTDTPPTPCVNSSRFSITYGFATRVDTDTGLARMERDLLKHAKKTGKGKSEKEKPSVLLHIQPYIENILLFVLAAFAHTLLHGNDMATHGYFFILYIVIIATLYGALQASFAIAFSSITLIFLPVTGDANIFYVLSDFNTVATIIVMCIIGMICGQARTRADAKNRERTQEMQALEDDLEFIHKINDENMKIKRELDTRLTNYQDSLAKIYDMTEKLYTLKPGAVFFAAVEVVADVMDTKDVSIYTVDGAMCRLNSSASQGKHKKSILISDLDELVSVIRKDKIYTNRDLNPDLPMLAAPVFSGKELVSIIMLWDVSFENLTLYYASRLMVVSRLVSSVIERAYAHDMEMRERNYLPGTNVLSAPAFADILKLHKEASNKNKTVFKLIEVGAEAGVDILTKLEVLLRKNDYMGQNPNSDNSIMVLLTEANTAGLTTVLSRFRSKGLTAREVKF